MTDDDVEQAGRLASGNVAALLPRRAAPSKRSACTANRTWRRRSGCSAASDSTRASPATSPPAIPSMTDHFWVNPFGMHFGHIRVSDLMLVRHDGTVVEGDRPLNQAAFAIHSQVHAARPDVIGAAHSHSVYGKTWSTLARLLDPITQDACAFYDDHALFDQYSGVVLDLEEGKRIAACTRRLQGRDPAKPRSAHRRPFGRGGGVVVHHDGAVLPGAAAGRGGGHAGAHRARRWPNTLRDKSARTSRAGSASSRCSRGSPASSPTCSTEQPATARRYRSTSSNRSRSSSVLYR